MKNAEHVKPRELCEYIENKMNDAAQAERTSSGTEKAIWAGKRETLENLFQIALDMLEGLEND